MAKRRQGYFYPFPLKGHVLTLTRTNGKPIQIGSEEIVSYKTITWGEGVKHRATMVYLQLGFYLVTQTPKTLKRMIETGGEA